MDIKNIIRNNALLKSIYWRVRKQFQAPSKTHSEEIYRLKCHGYKYGWEVPGVYRFPWGEMEYVSLGQLIIQYEEIYIKRHYAFAVKSKSPVIIDCGGNIGLSAIWFLMNYPECKITVFEPDANLAEIIRKNLKSAGYNPDICIQKAVWVKDGEIGFDGSGNDRGKISLSSVQMVETIDLASFLPVKTELLKLDIEGAEYEVIEHLCKTGALQRVNMLACELHVLRGYESRMISVLNSVIENRMKISLNYGMVGQWIGLAEEKSPFEVIGQNHLLIELYAWR
jgi:FkbM family methyltransferase